ncbi:hypothetical protein EV122DRAFT_285649 [Schizophyllum commune]
MTGRLGKLSTPCNPWPFGNTFDFFSTLSAMFAAPPLRLCLRLSGEQRAHPPSTGSLPTTFALISTSTLILLITRCIILLIAALHLAFYLILGPG